MNAPSACPRRQTPGAPGRGRPPRGFTIVELMIAIALMLMLMGVAVFVFVNAVAVFSRTNAEVEIYQSAQAAMGMIRSDVESCRPLLTPDGLPNAQQFIALFDADDDTDQTYPDGKWRFDRLCFRTTTTDPVTDQETERWILYWVDGADKASRQTGTLMKYVSPGLVPPVTSPSLAEIAKIGGSPYPGEPQRPAAWTADWIGEGAEICQNVSLFQIEVLCDPDGLPETVGRFFSHAATGTGGIKGYPSYNNGLSGAGYDPYLPAAGGLSGLVFNTTYYKDPPTNLAYNMYLTGWDVYASEITLPSQMRVTLRVQDAKGTHRRTIQEQIWIPMAQ